MKKVIAKAFILRLLVVAVAAALLAPSCATLPTPPAGKATKNVEVTAANGMVASGHMLASQAGVDILKAGGNAVDAAVAAAFAIGVVEPNANGIGGEGMIIIYLVKPGTAIAIDYRSAAPATSAFPKSSPSNGHAAAAIPGTVAGLSLALE